jgi:hypothetical protein
MLDPLAQAISGARFEVLDSGNVTPLLSPQLVAARMMEFLNAA